MGRRTLLLIASILVAALGTALIWLYVQGADNRAQAGEVEVKVFVAGATVSAGDAAQNVAPVQKTFPQSVVAQMASGGALVTSPTQIQGYTRTQIVQGTPLLRSQFSAEQQAPAPAVDLKPGEIGMQVSLPDPQRLAGLLQPGSLIRVYAPVTSGTTGKGVGVLFNQVRVLTSGPVTNPTGTAKSDVPQAIVTLALTNDQAKELVFAQSTAGSSLWFGLLGSDQTPRDKGGITSGISPGGS